ncbi:hypothetical protein PFICI_06165 [Pestalotiopsis fici W106-1]|uniref:Uncharacterized protein n=1 Tax=Pestalotiopsis fici (strain W106-1 / CGMCC3.15140) TaxID=1229662 RepID=W3X4W3_PESFW|nr:uncharacterized protein PFICI_06165 [Pestalotiopsis fici W106-1]ETS81163.1 hypothetical protein PFICI_06165 [Pestalotiopsis fici W106-1]
MHAGDFAQMSHNGFAMQPLGGMPAGGLASRRGGQNIKPLSFDSLKAANESNDTGVPTPRTSRSHLLAGLRTAPKSATTSTFPSSATAASTAQHLPNRNGANSGMYNAQENVYAGPKTSLPRLATQQQQQQQQQTYNPMMMGLGQHYTADQILAPPQLQFDEQDQEQMDPSFYAQLVAANMHLAQQQQRLQQQLLNIQAAAQQFQALNLSGQASFQQQVALQTLYQQQQQLQSLQQSLASMQQPQQNVYTYYDPATGKQAYYVDQSQAQYSNAYLDQPATPQNMTFQQATGNTPRVEVSPPPMENERPFFRSNSPPKKLEMTAEPTPLPPPSANAFRRGHKKASSIANQKGLSLSTEDANKAAGPKTAAFPISPLISGYGPGQARAGEHPVRQPRGPPSIDELRAKPTAKHEGSKNFAVRTRRSAVHNLVRAGLERRKGTSSSSGSMSPVSETAEEAGTPLTDNESDSGRSGSGSLSGDAEPSLASSRTSTSGSWGAIGSDRPSSRSKSRKSVESLNSASDSEAGSFASVFKHGTQRKPEAADGQRKAPMLVLTSAEKRKGSIAA